jgi:hypothetical protein
MAITVQKFLQLSGKRWNEIKNSSNANADQINQFTNVFAEHACEYDDAESKSLILSFINNVLSELERTTSED